MAKNPTLKQLESDSIHVLSKIVQVILDHPRWIKVLLPNVKKESYGNVMIDVQCVSSRKMTLLNSNFRKKNFDTDVLSFPAPDVFQMNGYLGDLVISKSKLIAQAAEYKHSVKVELQILLVHGVLHLTGLDHEAGKAKAKKMAEWEWKILQNLLSSRDRALPGLIHRTSIR